MTIKQLSKTHITWLAVLLIAALALSACSADDEPASGDTGDSPAASSGGESITSGESVSAETAPTAEPEKDPPAVPVSPKEVPESGSLQEDILVVFEQQVRAMNTFDVEMYLDTCIPGNITPADFLEFSWTEQGGEYGFQIPGFTLDGFNARDVEFRVYSDDTVRTTFEMFNHDTWVAGGVSRNWEKVDDRWYSTAMSCTSNRGTPN